MIIPVSIYYLLIPLSRHPLLPSSATIVLNSNYSTFCKDKTIKNCVDAYKDNDKNIIGLAINGNHLSYNGIPLGKNIGG